MTDCPNKVNVSELEPVFNWSEREVKIILLVVAISLINPLHLSPLARTNNRAWLPGSLAGGIKSWREEVETN